jgi:hypothetical protein
MANHRSSTSSGVAIAHLEIYMTSRLRAIEPNGKDMALLQSHVQRCGQSQGRWSNVQTAATAAHQFFAPRFATTLTLLLVVIITVSMAV